MYIRNQRALAVGVSEKSLPICIAVVHYGVWLFSFQCSSMTFPVIADVL